VSSSSPPFRGALLSLGLLALGATSALWASPQVDETVVMQRLVPYQGELEQSGMKVDGATDMAFSLYPARTGGTARWREEHAAVPVVSGRFTVVLGSAVPIPLEVMNAPELYLEVEVAGDVLQGRQRFFANPAAVAASHGVPPGAIMAFGGTAAPAGWLLCDGSEVRRTDFGALFAAIGSAHGSGDGATTFVLPDYRGRFLRGADNGVGRDPDRAARGAAAPGGNVGDLVGTVQEDDIGTHQHEYLNYRFDFEVITGIPGVPHIPEGDPWSFDGRDVAGNTSPAGGAETRPANAYVNWIIKY
jgi:hypothetical protein